MQKSATRRSEINMRAGKAEYKYVGGAGTPARSAAITTAPDSLQSTKDGVTGNRGRSESWARSGGVVSFRVGTKIAAAFTASLAMISHAVTRSPANEFLEGSNEVS